LSGDRIDGRADTMTDPVGWLRAVVVDSADPSRLSEFWQAVLGVGVVEAEADWIQLEPDRGGSFMAFEPAVAGASPTGFRTRPDIEVEDMDVARARIEALGGTLVEVIHARPGESHYRMADPEGNEFTVVLPLPPDVARKAYGPEGVPAGGGTPR
jgi:predicted enzyme related to lactoylglutathione lyase